MYGINSIGISNFNDKILVIENFNDSIKHRGQDNSGYFINSHGTLGRQRLAINDTSSDGNQSMLSGDKRYVLVYNVAIEYYQPVLIISNNLLKKPESNYNIIKLPVFVCNDT